MSVQAILTNTAMAKFTAARQGTIPPIVFTTLVVGNGQASATGYTEVTPDPAQTALVGQRDSTAVSESTINGDTVTVAGILDDTHGDYWVTEMGIEDQDGDLLLVGSVTPVEKKQSAGTELMYRVPITINSASSVVITMDPSAVYVTYDLLLQVLAEGGVKQVIRGEGDFGPTGLTTSFPVVGGPVDPARSKVNFQYAFLLLDHGVSVLGRLSADGASVEFERLVDGFQCTCAWEIVEYGTNFTGP